MSKLLAWAAMLGWQQIVVRQGPVRRVMCRRNLDAVIHLRVVRVGWRDFLGGLGIGVPGLPTLSQPGRTVRSQPGLPTLSQPGRMVRSQPGLPTLSQPGRMVRSQPGRMVRSQPGRSTPGGDGRPGHFHVHGLRRVPLWMSRGVDLLGAPIVRDLVQLLARLRKRIALARADLRHSERHSLMVRQLVQRRGQGEVREPTCRRRLVQGNCRRVVGARRADGLSRR
jgi:hypothetical protein